MEMWGHLGIQLLIFWFFPFLFARLRHPFRLVAYYVYIGPVLVFANFLGVVYSIQVTESIRLSGGNIAYAALMMTTILMVIIERDISIIRNVIRLVVILNVFFLVLYETIFWTLTDASTINPLGIPPSLFDRSLKIVIVGGTLIVSELVTLVFLFERVKRKVTNILLLSTIYVALFIVILCLDGFLFPTIAFTLDPNLSEMIRGGVGGKLVLGLAFGMSIFVFLLVFQNRLRQFVERPLPLMELVKQPKQELIREIKHQRQALGESEKTNTVTLKTRPTFSSA